MPTLAWSSLRLRVILTFVLAILPPLAVIGYTVTQWRQHEESEVRGDALHLAQHVAALHARLLEESRTLLSGLSQHPDMLGSDRARLREILLAFLEQHDRYDNIVVFERDGALITGVRPGAEFLISGDRPLIRRAIESRRLAVAHYGASAIDRPGTATFAYPVVEGSGEVGRVLCAVISFRWVKDLAVEAWLPLGSVVRVFDDAGVTVVQAPDSIQQQQAGLADTIVRAAIKRTTEGTTEVGAGKNGRYVVAVQALRGPWQNRRLFVAVGIPAAVATEYADRVIDSSLVAFAFAVALAFVVTWVGSERFLMGQVRTLVGAANRLRAGEMGARAHVGRGPRELKQVASAFDEMAAALQDRERQAASHAEQLARQGRRFHALFEHSYDGVVLFDEHLTVVHASASTVRVLGYQPDEMLGHTAFDFLHPDEWEGRRAVFADVMRSPGTCVTGIIRLHHKDGSWRWIEAVLTNLLHEPAVQAIVSNYRDVTQRREAEESQRRANEDLEKRVRERTAELTEANAALRSEVAERMQAEDTLRKLSRAIEQTGDSVFVTNRDGLIEYVNPSFEALTGFSREEAIGATPRRSKSGRHDPMFYQLLWQTLLAGEVFRAVFTNRTKDGRVYHEDQTISPIRDRNGVITHFVSTGRDVTRHHRTIEAQRRLNDRLEDEAKRIASLLHDEAGQFLTSAHITLADVARDLPKPVRDRLEEVRRHLNEVEEQFRHLSHELHPRILDDLGLVEAVRFVAAGVARRTGIRVTVEASLDKPCSGLVKTAVYRLVQEALTNISKHAQAASAAIILKRDGRNVVCWITDDGRGYTVDEAGAGEGARGLGLRVIQDRVEAAGGTFQIVSAPGNGTELLAVIPLEA